VTDVLENGAPVFYLHTLDLATGAERFNGPVALKASVPGTGRLKRMPQPLLDDEVALESGAASGSRARSSSSARYERGDPSPTVDA
jgi:hypothetical protein